MNENARVLVRPAAELLEAHSNVVPASLQASAERVYDLNAEAARVAALSEPTEQHNTIPAPDDANGSDDEASMFDWMDELYTDGAPHAPDALSETTREMPKYTGTRHASEPSALSRINDKVSPFAIARNMAAKRAALTPTEKAENLRRYGKLVLAAGGLALVGLSAYMGAKGMISHFGHDNNPLTDPNNLGTWHDGNSGSGNLNEHVTTMHNGSAVQADPNHVSPGVTHSPETPATTTAPETHTQPAPHSEPTESFRTAKSHDNTGRASNVTDWSRQTIYKEATEAGLTKSQAAALSHNQHNIDAVNNAFYHDNTPVAHDHLLNASTRYETTNQTTAADHLIDKFKASHHINTGTEAQQPTVDTAPPTPATTEPAATPSAEATPSTSPSETPAFAPTNTYEAPTGVDQKIMKGLIGLGAIAAATTSGFAIRAGVVGHRSKVYEERVEFARKYNATPEEVVASHSGASAKRRQAEEQAALAAAMHAEPNNSQEHDADIATDINSHRAKGRNKRPGTRRAPAPRHVAPARVKSGSKQQKLDAGAQAIQKLASK
jgi:hypothetical protein